MATIYGPQTPSQMAMRNLTAGPFGSQTPTQSVTSGLVTDRFAVGSLPKMGDGLKSAFGSISRGMTMASGIMGAFEGFRAAGGYREQARQHEDRAELALQQGFEQGIDIQREGRQITGSMTAMFGKSGTLLEGSPLLVLADANERIRENVERTIRQGRILQSEYLATARSLRKAARSSMWSGVAQVAGVVAAPFTGGASLGLSAAQWG